MASSPQVASWPFVRQTPPAPAAHSAGAPVQEQVAVVPLTVQGFPVGQVVVLVIARQPSALLPHVITCVLLDAQRVPAAPVHAAGAAGQVHAALGKLPVHGLPAVQVSDDFS